MREEGREKKMKMMKSKEERRIIKRKDEIGGGGGGGGGRIQIGDMKDCFAVRPYHCWFLLLKNTLIAFKIRI